MSRIEHITTSLTFIPNSYENSGSSSTNFTFTNTNYPITYAYTNADSSSSANAYLPRTANVVSALFLNFNVSSLSDVPSYATISSIAARSKHRVNSTTYVAALSIQLYNGTTAKGSATTSRTTDVTTYNLTTGTWTRSELDNIRLYVKATRANNNRNNAYVYLYGADVTVDLEYDLTYYAISTSSSVQGVGISAQDSETTSGGTNIITVTGVSNLSDIKLMDNGTDVTSSLVRSGSNYTYTLNNVDADHTITVESGIPTYSVNASSTYTGATIVANPTTVQEGSNCVLTLTTQYITKVKVEDNGNDITSQFTTGSNNTYTYTLTNVTTAHTVIVSELTKTLYMNVENVMKTVNSIQKKVDGGWTTIPMIDFWRKVNGNYANDTTVSGKTSLVYGGVLETIVYDEIGTVNKSTSDLTITINDNALQSGTYKMFYEDINRSIIDRIDEITEFTI